ncbi:MAG: hypothetical protein FJ088_09090, partial [Deltaproteobacteria bacterium]|nr:hypothetical protein [Deltaproteobacteria bacterium]
SVLTMKDITGGAEGLSDEDRSEAIYARVKEAYENRDKSRPFYLLIIGDAEYFDNGEDFLVPAPKSSIGWEPGYSDNFYADMNGDHVPDIAVGRIPVRNDKDGAAVLDKIKQHENSYEPGLWNRRLNVYAGEGDFGPEIDAAIELAVQKGFEEVSYDFDIRFAYDNPASDYYYAPFQEITLKLLTEGAVMVVYIGHGGGETEVSSLTLLKSQHRFPMAVFFACGTGDFLMLDDSDPEILMKQTGAPFEFLVSETTSHPYGNAIFAREL